MKITDFEAQLVINGFADVDGTRVVSHGVQGVTEAEARAYIADAKELYPHETITVLEISPAEDGNGTVAIDYTVQPPRFERVRRITGYLVGTLDRFNDAKRAEVKDRLTHEI